MLEDRRARPSVAYEPPPSAHDREPIGCLETVGWMIAAVVFGVLLLIFLPEIVAVFS